jgi:hypothetical protein
MTQRYQPLIMTYKQLEKALLPYCYAYKWGRDTIHDLWKMGAPMPDGGGARLILPAQLRIWLSDVLTAQGLSLEAVESNIYRGKP